MLTYIEAIYFHFLFPALFVRIYHFVDVSISMKKTYQKQAISLPRTHSYIEINSSSFFKLDFLPSANRNDFFCYALRVATSTAAQKINEEICYFLLMLLCILQIVSFCHGVNKITKKLKLMIFVPSITTNKFD